MKGVLCMRLHTKEVSYYLLAMVSLGASLLFSYRAAIVYYTVFLPMAGHLVSLGFGIFIFFALGVSEFVASLQWSKKARNWAVIAIVIIHDAGSIFYAIFTYQGWSFILLGLGIGMTAVSALPFLFGHWMQEFVPYLETERNQRHADWLSGFQRRMEKKAVKTYEKEVKGNAATLKRFAPTHIQQLVEGTGHAIYPEETTTPAKITAFPSERQLRSAPVTPAPIDAPIETDYESDPTEPPYTIEEEDQQPFQQGRLK